jgi:hypothetical protein
MYWKLALAQHPMYLLIKEDTSCAERTRPWGEPDIESYIARLRQNLATLRQHPEIKIGYEWSGLELEQLAYDAPDVFSEMLNLVKAGQSSFYNGTYAQPHLQTLSSESNYRQFEWGARVYRELCNTQVQVYAHQESSVNEQTPQLLRAFGIRYAALPRFLSALRIREGGELLFHGRFGLMFTHGDEFAEWRGLDGTVTDLYLVEPNHLRVPEWIRFQEILGLSHVPPVMIEMPDLVAVDEQWISGRSGAEFALLDEVLAERRQICPPRFQVGFHTDWSYIEGIRRRPDESRVGVAQYKSGIVRSHLANDSDHAASRCLLLLRSRTSRQEHLFAARGRGRGRSYCRPCRASHCRACRNTRGNWTTVIGL